MNLFGPIAAPVTADIFAGWPNHMQTEFALLAAERGLTGKAIFQETGIPPGALSEVCSHRHRFRLPQVAGYHVDDDAPADPHRNFRRKAGRGDAP